MNEHIEIIRPEPFCPQIEHNSFDMLVGQPDEIISLSCDGLKVVRGWERRGEGRGLNEEG